MHPNDRYLEYHRVLALHATGLLSLPAPPEFKEICDRAQERFQVAAALVTLITDTQQIVKAGVGTVLQETSRSVAFCDHTIRSDEMLIVPDTTQDPRFAANPLVTGEPYLRFYAGAPLVYMQNIRLGALCLLDTAPRNFLPEEQAELAEMAEEVLIAAIQWQFDRTAHMATR